MSDEHMQEQETCCKANNALALPLSYERVSGETYINDKDGNVIAMLTEDEETEDDAHCVDVIRAKLLVEAINATQALPKAA